MSSLFHCAGSDRAFLVLERQVGARPGTIRSRGSGDGVDGDIVGGGGDAYAPERDNVGLACTVELCGSYAWSPGGRGRGHDGGEIWSRWEARGDGPSSSTSGVAPVSTANEPRFGRAGTALLMWTEDNVKVDLFLNTDLAVDVGKSAAPVKSGHCFADSALRALSEQ